MDKLNSNTYKDTQSELIIQKVKENIQESITFKDLIDTLQKEDTMITGRLPLNKFTNMVIKITNNKINIAPIYNLLNLIYPFKWPHGLIPNLNLNTTKYLNAIFPYIIGVLRDKEYEIEHKKKFMKK